MSLTSYRAAPPRGKAVIAGLSRKFESRAWSAALCLFGSLLSIVLCRPGSDLLSQVLRHSTIGAEEFNGRVRDGIGYRLPANTTRPAKDGLKQA